LVQECYDWFDKGGGKKKKETSDLDEKNKGKENRRKNLNYRK